MFPVVRLAGSCRRASYSGCWDSTVDFDMVVVLDIVAVRDMLADRGMAVDLDGIAVLDMAADLDTIDVPGMAAAAAAAAAADLHTIADLDVVEFWPDMKSSVAKGCQWAIRAVRSLH